MCLFVLLDLCSKNVFHFTARGALPIKKLLPRSVGGDITITTGDVPANRQKDDQRNDARYLPENPVA